MFRKLTKKEIDAVIATEMEIVTESGDLNKKELIDFREIITEEISEYWTTIEFNNYFGGN